MLVSFYLTKMIPALCSVLSILTEAAKPFSIAAFLLLYSSSLCAQKDTTSKVTLSAYGELYYSYDFSRPENHEKPNFIFNHKRHNELNANLLLLKASYHTQKIRSNLALMAGTYPQYNLSSEPSWAQFIYEANMGIALSKKHDFWMDAGIFTSHLGFESAIGADCWTLSRSMMAENSPYYESGIKFSYTTPSEHLYFAALVLNGWQRIYRYDNRQTPSFGFQCTYHPRGNISFNYSNYWGSDQADSQHSFRHFHNLYAQYESHNHLGILVGFDLGQEFMQSAAPKIWFTPIILVRQAIDKKLFLTLRAEYYQDKEQVIIQTGAVHGFQTLGYSANMDYWLFHNVILRFEGKILHALNGTRIQSAKENYCLSTSMGIKL